MSEKRYGADLIVDSLINHNVKYAFGIPGAKIDRVFDLLDNVKGPKMVVTRHEQGAAFMAQAVGRLTGEPGVVIVTSGPAISNLATPLLTATSEGDAILAIGGQVKRSDRLKRAHQSTNNAALLAPTTKYSEEVLDASVLSETIANAYRISKTGRAGAAFISVPQDVTDSEIGNIEAIKPLSAPKMGNASIDDINYLAQAIKNAVLPVILVGAGGSDEKVATSLRNLLTHVNIPVVETFQGAGVISRDLEHTFYGRIGLFRNQPGDFLLKRSDLVIAVGYDPIEYEARNWNAEIDSRIIVIDNQIAEIDTYYQPERELIGNIAATLDSLLPAVRGYELPEGSKEYLAGLKKVTDVHEFDLENTAEGRMHPLDLVTTFQDIVKDDETVTVDVGSLYIWMARHFKSYEPRHLLFSNGMQTLGVALPWAITSALYRPGKKVYSHSGDGGFLFTGNELETAVRLNLPIVQIIWNDGHYDMVKFQEEMKYGRSAAVDFGVVDYVKYAESMGAKGYRATTKEEFAEILKSIPEATGPVVIDVMLDYSDNVKLADKLLPEEFY